MTKIRARDWFAWLGGIAGFLALAVHNWTHVTDFYEAPHSFWRFLLVLASMFTDATPIGLTILAFTVGCFAVATSEWWLPPTSTLWTRYFSPAESNGRVSLVDFASIAAKDYGWKFGNDSYESLDFVAALKQAHIDGSIELDGRLGCDGKEEDSIIWHPLVAIPRDHLTRPNWDLDVPRFFRGTRNFDISTYRMGGSAEGRYRDIHVRDKAKALEWLKVDAQTYRGVTEQLETKRQDRLSEWKDLRLFEATDRGSGDLGLSNLFDYLMNKAKAFTKIADSGERHEAIDIALRDALGLGRLLSYGRPAGDWIDPMTDAVSTMRIIETAFWSSGAEIEWTTIDSTAPHHQRCVAKSRDGTTYYDLQFDAAQIEKLWPV